MTNMDNNEQFKVESYISDSHLAFLQGQYEVSLILAKEVLQKEPKNSDAHQWRNMNAWHTKKL